MHASDTSPSLSAPTVACLWTRRAAWLAAALTPLAYLWLYTPYGMDTTDFGFFYGYPWRILQGEVPYRDFYYINPALPLYWHALWLKITPAQWGVLGGKAGFVAVMYGAAWCMTLFLDRVFDLDRMNLPAPLLAVAGFVWGVHTFPHVPWHTADGVFFFSAALLAGAAGRPSAAGVLACMALLAKQSFMPAPVAVLAVVFFLRPRREVPRMLLACALAWLAWWGFLKSAGAWEAFRFLTSNPLDFNEALEAGILIYLRQEWQLPALCALPWILWKARRRADPVPQCLQPALIYLVVIAARYMHTVGMERGWIGFGESWPTLWTTLGVACVLAPGVLLRPWLREADGPRPSLRAAAVMAAAVLTAWSAGISGGYKTPAMGAPALIFALLLVHARLGGKAAPAAWTALLLGLLMFRTGYEYPYVFPAREMPRAGLTYDAGQVFSKASGVYVDKEMFDTLRELKDLRARYGPNYRVLPGFPHAYYLTDDPPAFPSEWLLDWQIANQFDKVYQELLDRDVTVFMLREQMDAIQADGYARAGYTVPQMVRRRWRIVEETPRFVVMRPPRS